MTFFYRDVTFSDGGSVYKSHRNVAQLFVKSFLRIRSFANVLSINALSSSKFIFGKERRMIASYLSRNSNISHIINTVLTIKTTPPELLTFSFRTTLRILRNPSTAAFIFTHPIPRLVT